MADDLAGEVDQIKELLSGKVIDDFKVLKAIASGGYGATFAVQHVKSKTPACLKVALNSNRILSLETSVMKLFIDKQPQERSRHLCRIYTNGTINLVVDGIIKEVYYVVMEFLPGNLVSFISQYKGYDYLICGCELALQMLNGLYNMHCLGILHRDIKAENVGFRNGKTAVLLDFGLARIITDVDGNIRSTRSRVCVRGTNEWASGNCERGMEQGRVDDLMGWMYTLTELFYHNDDLNCLPWAEYEKNERLRHLMKSPHLPANLILRDLPNEFYQIYAYLHTLSRMDQPNYQYIILLLLRAKKKFSILKTRDMNKNHKTAKDKEKNEIRTKYDPLMNKVDALKDVEQYNNEMEEVFDIVFGN
ncbi:unnamed protein product [Bursaphelenchus xylophilus]|uniref:(pine wood nematode) hypothetical protein n=1 Tax=Bursaphelenchus xylophilus TaxID=6326 RepID=A0A1I7RNC5_BURXY|nr:unnamed protein product [Bursaphelenchus xylophilus]CAG9123874.1 unnamed protein product [Bursaphelenchus xylophilus]